MPRVGSVAVVGVGPAGAITIDALVQEAAFDVIKVFERREKPGGCWIPDPPDSAQQIPDFTKLASRTADEPLSVPAKLPTWTPRSSQYRFSDTSIYPTLETNITAQAMAFSQEPIPDIKSAFSIERHGADTPFRHHTVVQQYIEDLVNRNGYAELVSFNTTVELVEKVSDDPVKWQLTLRKEVDPSPSSSPKEQQDYWWTETFDAVVIASGHYNVPFIPHIEGIAEFAKSYPGCIEHSKSFRGTKKYEGKRVLTVGASISGPDIASFLASTVKPPLHASVRGRYHPYFGDWAFRHPCIQRHGPISHISGRTIYFEDGTSIADVDHIILGTGYSWTLPFLPDVEVRNNRVPGLYFHVFRRGEPSMVFVGAVAAGFTFKVFEWQAVLAARYLAGRIALPPDSEQEQWERDRIAARGDGVPFTALYPDFEEYFEGVMKLAGEPTNLAKCTGDREVVGDGEWDEQRKGNRRSIRGRTLPAFEKEWRRAFDEGHLKRIAAWKRVNEKASTEREIAKQNGNVKGGVLNGINNTDVADGA